MVSMNGVNHNHNHHPMEETSTAGSTTAPLNGEGEEGVEGPLRHDVLCLLWVGTAGLGGHLLGTDEEDIVFLKTLVYHVPREQILAEQSYTIKPPPPPPPPNNTNNNNNNNNHHHPHSSTSSTNSSTNSTTSEAERVFHLNENCVRDYQLSEEQVRNGERIEDVFRKIEDQMRAITHCLDTNTPYSPSSTFPPTNGEETDSANSPVFITDGQCHLRQVIHPKMMFHRITTPLRYDHFFDLRKEFRSCYRTPQEINCVADMLNYLDISMTDEENIADRSCRAMVKVMCHMAQKGHVFRNPEEIQEKLEQGSISKGDEVDSGCVIRARGLPWMSTDVEIAKFFKGLNLAKAGVALCLSQQGRRNGEALINFASNEHREMALKRHKHHMGGRYIEVYKATGEDFISVANGNNNEASQFLARGNLILRMRGLPYDCTAKQVVDFFETGEDSIRLVENEDGVLFVRKPDGRATGDAFVMLGTEEDILLAMKKHKKSIGSRYIELFRSSSGEVINRSMNNNEQAQQQAQPPSAPSLPLIPTLPPMVAQLMPPQQVPHTGMVKDCIRLRGLPFEAQIESVLDFLGEFSRSIKFRGVHMVYTTDGQPSGEAFIQMASEQAAWAAATHRHNKYMYFGKKNRYIEVFQCSSNDMNYVLSGMLGPPSPQTPSNTPVNRSLLSTAAPTGTSIYSPFAYPMVPSTTVIGHPPRLAAYPPTAIATAAAPAPPAYHAPPPPVYYYYPSPPVSPTTTTYYSTIGPQIIPSECYPLHATASPEVPLHAFPHHHHVHHHNHHPGEAVATM